MSPAAKLVLEHSEAVEERNRQIANVLVAHDEALSTILDTLPELKRELFKEALGAVRQQVIDALGAEVRRASDEHAVALGAQNAEKLTEAIARSAATLGAEIAERMGALAKQNELTLDELVAQFSHISQSAAALAAKAAFEHHRAEIGEVVRLELEKSAPSETDAPAAASLSLADIFRGPIVPGAQMRRGEVYTYNGSSFLVLQDTTEIPTRANIKARLFAVLASRGSGGGGSSSSGGDSLPSQTGNSGKFLKTDGTTPSWESIPGGGDMLAANNLSDVANAATAFGNIKQDATTAATGVVELATDGETAAGKVVQGNDSRLSDSRAPSGTAGGVLSGTYPDPGFAVDMATQAELNAHTGSTSNPHSVTKAQVGLSNVTDDAQTKAAIVPNTAPSAGQVLAGNAGGTAYAPVSVSGDGTLSSAGALTVTKTNNVAFAASATTDTTNAANISSGTLPDGRFPATLPAASGVNLTALNAANLGSGVIPDARMPNLTGPVTTVEGAVATTLATVIQIACSDTTTDITTGTGKATFRMPHAMTLTDVRASVSTAPTGSTIVIDINESGTTVLSTKLSIDASEKTSTTAATPPVISDSALADDAEITIDFDQVGSSTAGKGVVVTLIGTRS